MIPRTYPSTFALNGQQQMVVYFLTSVAGLQRWVDYIPVKLTQGGVENSYNNNGYINVAVLPSLSSQTQAWKEYIPVYQDDVATDAWQVNSIGYIPYNYAQFGDASLMLDFTNGGSIDPRVTFTRASNATVTGPDGVLQYAPHNLLTFSEQFDNAGWSKAACTVAANAVSAPDGTATADSLIEDTTNAFRAFVQNFVALAGTQYTISFYVKAATRSLVRVYVGAAGSWTTPPSVVFDLSSGTVNSGAGTITPLADGWYRCSATGVFGATGGTTSASVGPVLTSGGTNNYLGTGATALHLWGAQLNVGSLQTYYPTTRKNLLGFTQEFDGSGWTKNAVTVSADVAVDPQGFMTADKLVEGTGSNAPFVIQSPPAYVAGTPYTFTCYAKEDPTSAKRYLMLLLPSAAFGVNIRGVFDLGDGTFTTTGTATVSMDFVGNGWWRCRVTATASTTTSSGLQVRLSNVGTGSVSSYTGDGTSGLFIWGAQLSDSASLDPYVYNPGAAPASTAYFGPRFDYDPVTLAPKGLLIEEQRTNLLLRSEEFDNAAWAKTRSSITANTVVAPSGELTGDQLVEDTTASSTHDMTVSASFTSGTAYTISIYAKQAGRNLRIFFPTAAFSSAFSAVFDLSAGTATIALTGTVASITNVGNGWYRCSITQTATASATSNFTLRLIEGASTPSYTGDGYSGIYIWGAQLEAAAFPTSYIPTVASQVTRTADVAVMTGANFSSWYRADEGTLFVDGVNVAVSTTLLAVSDGTLNNRIQADAGTNTRVARVVAGGVTQASNTIAYTFGNIQKFALAYQTDSVGFANNGVLGTEDTSATIPVVDRMFVGANGNGGAILNGHIRKIAYFPRRLANAELQAITS